MDLKILFGSKVLKFNHIFIIFKAFHSFGVLVPSIIFLLPGVLPLAFIVVLNYCWWILWAFVWKKNLFLTSFLKYVFAEYRTLDQYIYTYIFFLSGVVILLHYLLICIFPTCNLLLSLFPYIEIDFLAGYF